MMRRRDLLASLAGLVLTLAGCVSKPNGVGDPRAELQALVDVLRDAYARRDVDTLLGLASERFREPAGTPAPEDDVDFAQLEAFLRKRFDTVLRIEPLIEVTAIRVTGDEAWIDTHQQTRFWLKVASGVIERALDDDVQLHCRREGGRWKVVSGL